MNYLEQNKMNSYHYFLLLHQLGSQPSVVVDGDLMGEHSPAQCNLSFVGTPFVKKKERGMYNDSEVH